MSTGSRENPKTFPETEQGQTPARYGSCRYDVRYDHAVMTCLKIKLLQCGSPGAPKRENHASIFRLSTESVVCGVSTLIRLRQVSSCPVNRDGLYRAFIHRLLYLQWWRGEFPHKLRHASIKVNSHRVRAVYKNTLPFCLDWEWIGFKTSGLSIFLYNAAV